MEEYSYRGPQSVPEHPCSPAAKAFVEIVEEIEDYIEEKDMIKRHLPDTANNK